jgi:hypothetical protein
MRRDVEGSGPLGTEKKYRKIVVRISGVRAEIQTRV